MCPPPIGTASEGAIEFVKGGDGMRRTWVVAVPSRHLVMLALVVSAALGGIGGCATDRCTDPVCWEDGPQIAFAAIGYCAAWGHTYSGWYIDYSGCVFTVSAFSETADSLWAIEQDGVMTPRELRMLERRAERTDLVVDEDSLRAMRKLTVAAARGPFTDHHRGCSDCGVWRYLGLFWNYEDEGYRPVLLYKFGEETITNDSPAALRLHEWLESIAEDVPSPWGQNPMRLAG